MKYKITTPNINLQSKNPKMAYVARAAALIGSAVVLILQLFHLLSGDIRLIPILLGVIPLIIEFGVFTLFMKKPLFRGIAYVILGIVLLGFTPIYAAGIIILSGALFIIYEYQ